MMKIVVVSIGMQSEDVRKLQEELAEIGFLTEKDGYFSESLDEIVREFQTEYCLLADGIVGRKTWKAILCASNLKGFKGDPGWVHAREGHKGSSYWPGGESGVTLDPGVDLGYTSPVAVENLYGGILTYDQLKALDDVYRLRGESAKNALMSNPVIQSIRISPEDAEFLFPVAAKPYWVAINKRFGLENVIPAVQTVMLSLSYNRGAQNEALEELKTPIINGEWEQIANIIGNMQQDHPLLGIRKRRKLEADYIRSFL